MHIFENHDNIKRITMKGADTMNPRIFISSTFYDLRYAREDLGNFIRDFGFEPIRSETGNIGYTPGVELDESCYTAMRNSDMAILIVGSRYGSPASGEAPTDDEFKKFSSVTCNEFKTALINNVPVYVFIEDGVNTEYRFYKKNKEHFERQAKTLRFDAVEHINVLRFVDDIRSIPRLPIFEFRTISEIKDTLRLQWADLFREHLTSLKQQASAVRQVEPQITQIYTELQEMRVMLQKVGQTTLADAPQELEAVFAEQHVENAAGKIAGAFEFVSSLNDSEIHDYMTYFIQQLFEAKRQGLLEYPFSDDLEDQKLFFSLFDHEKICIFSVKEHLAFEEGIFKDSDEFRTKLVDRLCGVDYLQKMRII